MKVDQTHDPELTSWVPSANAPGADFPIQNLPVGVFSIGGEQRLRSGVAIGDSIYEIAQGDLSWYMALPAWQRRELRIKWSEVLRSGASEISLHRQADCRMHLPCTIGDYSDFYASIHHASNVGSMFRPDNPLLPNYRHVPIGYHGRASSVVVSGTPVKRPAGQLAQGQFGHTRELDYEVELGCFIGPGSMFGSPVPIDQAIDHIVGVCLLNDWSARDIQRWEYQPLGPFLSKSFATSISPWIVTTEALAPFFSAPPEHETQVLPYLAASCPGALDVVVSAELVVENLCMPLSQSNFKDMYWTFPQMLAHQSSNGCNLRAGDLLGSGTISGPERNNRGCLLELTWRGADPICLPDGSTRTFLMNGDRVVLAAHCHRPETTRIGFGNCSGTIVS